LSTKKVLIIGSGGREHALTWKIAQSPQVEHIYVAPGNAGTAQEKKVSNVTINVNDLDGLLSFAQENTIDLTIVGPEVPLATGIVDIFEKRNLHCIGPCKQAAQLEASKDFAKVFMKKYNIPTAEYKTFTNSQAAKKYAQEQKLPMVIKNDGLAAGKGVVIAQTLQEAEGAIEQMLVQKKFGHVSEKIIVEEFLEGHELSFIILTDGKNIVPLASSQDHKRLLDNNKGPNTGGMGAISPSPVMTKQLHDRIMQEIIEPTIIGMAQEGCQYTGFLYAGLMITKEGDPKVLEFNCRLGDPETQVIMLRLQSDLYSLCKAACSKQLDTIKTLWNPQPAVGVVLVSGGYPIQYKKGNVINGLVLRSGDLCRIFHAGTVVKDDIILTSGGRVMCVCALGENLDCARELVYKRIKKIKWPDMFCRADIGF